MKAALCFIISYTHELSKESIWRQWIQPNEDIINVYFHYKNYNSITSEWIKKYTLPKEYIVQTDYLHVVPAYISLLKYALKDDKNQWFCFLTDTCVPIIPPSKFRQLFLENNAVSFMSWKKAWWNVHHLKRANLQYLLPQYHLANCPWFILTKDHAIKCILYSEKNAKIYHLICSGIVANESVFAIMLYCQDSLEDVKNEDTTATDWTRMTSATSPYVFTCDSPINRQFIDKNLTENKNTIFLRKVDKNFPDSVLLEYITDP